ncbi:TetR/AcrR family transcriptional regulator [Streptococcus didelphis]|uniref:TetR/AcrR family transcriptional regulator n=1 Tax=Streptococcus didelphis TaxID=102886 RepID=UPI000363E89D|nr:TetR/AcrR family transcriptional regulator [Streptococcus didelphis]
MTNKIRSKKSLQNLTQFNKESQSISRESLETALLYLLEKKSLAQISISELVAKAGVSRNAFYRNYNSKDDILMHLLKEFIRRIFKGIKLFDISTQASQAWYYLFTEAKKEERFLKIIFNQQLQHLLTQLVTKRLKAYQRWRKNKQSHYAGLFWSNAIVSVFSNWIKDDMVIPAEEMAKIGLPLLN